MAKQELILVQRDICTFCSQAADYLSAERDKWLIQTSHLRTLAVDLLIAVIVLCLPWLSDGFLCHHTRSYLGFAFAVDLVPWEERSA